MVIPPAKSKKQALKNTIGEVIFEDLYSIFPILDDFFPIFRVRPTSIFRDLFFFPISGRRSEIGILPGTHTRNMSPS